MAQGLKRFQEAHCLRFVTFSCYHRAPLLASAEARRIFEQTLEQVRHWYRLYVTGYVVMPEHVHLLIIMSHALPPVFSGKPVTTTSTYGASRSGSRSYVTSIATQ
jgi:REP element-mobilizing transposase RayT